MEHRSKNDKVRFFITVTAVMALCISGFSLMLTSTNAKADVIGGAYGSEVHVAVFTELTSDNAVDIATKEEWNMMTLVYDSLARTDPDTLDSVPWLAKSWEINTTGANPVAYVELNDATWHDGSTVTAQSVADSYNAMKGNSLYSSLLTGVTITAEDGMVKFELDQPMGNLVSEIFQVPLTKSGIGSGPFMLYSDYDANPIVLEAYDDYFDGRAYLNYVNFHVYDNENFVDDQGNGTQLGLDWTRGELDFIATGIEPYQVAITFDDPITGTPSKIGDFGSTKLSPSMTFFYMGLNLNNAPLDDMVFRQVLSMCCDKNEIALTDFGNYATAADSPVLSANTYWYNNSLEYMGLKDVDGTGAVVADELSPMMSMLGQAGFNDVDGDGWRDMPDGSPFSLNLLSPPAIGEGSDTKIDAITGRLEGVFDSLGIKVIKIDSRIDNGEMMEEVEANNFDLYLNYYETGLDPSYLNDLFQTNAEDNYFHYSNADVDSLLADAMMEMDKETRQEYIWEAQGILNEELPAIPLAYPKRVELYTTDNLATGWKTTAGGMHNFWTYTNLRQPISGDLKVTMTSSVGSSIDSGEATTIQAIVTDADSNPAVGSYVSFSIDGQGVLSTTEQIAVDENGIATVEYTAPNVESPVDEFISVVAVQESFNSADYSIGITVHELDFELYITDVEIEHPTIDSGDSTEVTFVVVDQNGDPVTDAIVTAGLELTNFGGTITAPTSTGTDGEYSSTFSAVVTTRTKYGLLFMAEKEGYITAQNDNKQVTVEPLILSVTISPEENTVKNKNEITITVTVMEGVNKVEGVTVTLTMTPTGTDSTLTPDTATTNAEGEATFTFYGEVEEDTQYRLEAQAQKDAYVSAEDAHNILVDVKPEETGGIPMPGIALVMLLVLGLAVVLYKKE